MTDQPTGPEAAADVAARMPGWKRLRAREWEMPDGRFRSTKPGQIKAWRFRPDKNIADAMEVAQALQIRFHVNKRDVVAWNVKWGNPVVISTEDRSLVQAVCAAVCGVAVQLPEAREGREDNP